MTASTRFWKVVTLGTSCAIEPPRPEPIQIRLSDNDDNKQFVITMTVGEAESLVKNLTGHIAHLRTRSL